jgi:putative peptidoglycan lipid II flippase
MLGRQSLFAGTLSLGTAQLLSLGLGFVQLTYFIYVFGSTKRTDALFIAQTVPYFLSLLFNQSFVHLCVPTFLHIREQMGDQEAWKFASTLITLGACALLLLATFAVALAPLVVALLAPGFAREDRQLAAALLRWLSILMCINGLCGIPRALYFSYRTYAVPAVALLFPSLCIIGGIFLFHKQLGIYSFVVGAITGALLQFTVLVLFLNVGERRLMFHVSKWHQGLREFFPLLRTHFMILGMHNVNMVVDRSFASTLGAASVSALDYANTMAEAPLGWMRSTFGTTIVPILSSHAARQELEPFRQQIRRFLGLAVFLVLPAVILLMTLAGPLVRALFQRGAFRVEDARLVSMTLFCYSLGLVPAVANAVLSAGLFSLKDLASLFRVSCIVFVLNLLLDYVLMRMMGVAGLALATALIMASRLILFHILLEARVGSLKISQITFSLLKTVAAGIGMGILVVLLAYYLKLYDLQPRPTLDRLVALAVVCALGGATYLMLCRLLKVPDALAAMARLQHFLFRKLERRTV